MRVLYTAIIGGVGHAVNQLPMSMWIWLWTFGCAIALVVFVVYLFAFEFFSTHFHVCFHILSFICVFASVRFHQPDASPTVLAARAASVALQSCSSLRLWYMSRMLHRSMQRQRIFHTFIGAKLHRGANGSVQLQHAVKPPGVYAWYSQFRRSIEVRRVVDRLSVDVATKKPGASTDLKKWIEKLKRVVDIELSTQSHPLPSLRQIAPSVVEALVKVGTPFPYDQYPLLTHVLYGDGVSLRQIVGACTDADNVMLTATSQVRANPGRGARSEKRKAENPGTWERKSVCEAKREKERCDFVVIDSFFC